MNLPRALLQISLLASALAMTGLGHADDAPTDWVTQQAKAIDKQVVEWRRYLHAHPELSNQEANTGRYIAQQLKSFKLDDIKTGVANHGVVAVLKGKLPGPVVALRADMDGLPIKESTGLAYASKAKGLYFGKETDVMHGCGHDTHMAMLLGAAKLLSEHRDKVPGTIVFIFQPAEEGSSEIDVFDPQHPS